MNLSSVGGAILIFLFSCSAQVFAQEVGTKIDFFGYADNREYKAPHTINKTFFGTTLTPQLYLKLDQTHQIVGVIHYNQDLVINPVNKKKVSAISYYNQNTKFIDFGIRFIPRLEKQKHIPLHELKHTLLYVRPHIEGMFFIYK